MCTLNVWLYVNQKPDTWSWAEYIIRQASDYYLRQSNGVWYPKYNAVFAKCSIFFPNSNSVYMQMHSTTVSMLVRPIGNEGYVLPSPEIANTPALSNLDYEDAPTNIRGATFLGNV